MSTSSQLIQRVENAVYHQPYLIPKLFTECGLSHGFLHSRLRRYIPHRVGIEFECFGNFARPFIAENHPKWRRNEDFESYFKLKDFSQENELRWDKFERMTKSLETRISEDKSRTNEVRVSICDYRQLIGLYSILNEMAKYCTISPDCGIHIHIDLTRHGSSSDKDKAVDWFNKHLSDVESIFPPYTGSYNEKIARRGKQSWVNLSSKDTVEFRIAPLTFDYEVLIVWIVKCSKLVSQMVRECYAHQGTKKLKVKTKSKSLGLSDREMQEMRDTQEFINELNAYRYRADYIDGVNEWGTVGSDGYTTFSAVNTGITYSGTSSSIARGRFDINSLWDMFYQACSDAGLDVWVSQRDRLVLDAPDGTRYVIGKEEALISYINGGIARLLSNSNRMGDNGDSLSGVDAGIGEPDTLTTPEQIPMPW